MNVFKKLEHLGKEGKIGDKLRKTLNNFYLRYQKAAISNKKKKEEIDSLSIELLELIAKQITSPFKFPIYHRSLRYPIDYYKFALNFFKMVIKMESSAIFGKRNLAQIAETIAEGENVVLFANHQTEPDPQAISLLLEKDYPDLAENLIMVAGHRVVSDPVAIPFSMGTNLLCIYSKKYIEYPKEKKDAKLTHNRRTMRKLSELLSEGGKLIYVAPAGGRDRKEDSGNLKISPFDPQSVEMFRLMALRSLKKTRFFPLALKTYDLMPPPPETNIAIGEERLINMTPVFLSFGEELDIHLFDNAAAGDKKERRKMLAKYVEKSVIRNYEIINKRERHDRSQ